MSKNNRAYAVTISTRGDIDEELVNLYIDYMDKNEGGYGIIENSASGRHLHFQIFYDTHKVKGDVSIQMKRIFSKYQKDGKHIDSIAKVAVVVKWAYNNDFMDCYLQKDIEGEAECCYDARPDDWESAFYPTQEEQKEFMKKNNATDPQLEMYSSLYREWEQMMLRTNGVAPLCNLWSIKKWYGYACYGDAHHIRVQQDPRKRSALLNCLYSYLIEDVDAFIPEDKDNLDNKRHREFYERQIANFK